MRLCISVSPGARTGILPSFPRHCSDQLVYCKRGTCLTCNMCRPLFCNSPQMFVKRHCFKLSYFLTVCFFSFSIKPLDECNKYPGSKISPCYSKTIIELFRVHQDITIKAEWKAEADKYILRQIPELKLKSKISVQCVSLYGLLARTAPLFIIFCCHWGHWSVLCSRRALTLFFFGL